MKLKPDQPIESFDYFIGKVCTIYTRPTNWKLNFEQTIDHFLGIVTMVNECGICITNPINHNRTFVMMPSVIAISEETVVDQNDEEAMKTIREYEERKKEVFKHNPNVYPKSDAPKSYSKSDGSFDLETLKNLSNGL